MIKKAYFIAAMKRSGQHGVVNWLAQQNHHDTIHFNDCHVGWDQGKLLPMKDAMAVFYSWNDTEGSHTVKNYFHDWKLDLEKSKQLVQDFYTSFANNDFANIQSCIYNVEDFDLSIYEAKHFDKFPQLGNRQKILLIRSAPNFVGSCLQRKIDPPDAGATDVADYLTQRMKLWKQHAKAALDSTNDWYTIKFDEWFSNIEYRKQICKDLNLYFTDNGLNTVMNFGSGSSFDRQKFDEKAQSMKVLERWKQYHDQKELQSYIDEEVSELNEKLFGIQ